MQAHANFTYPIPEMDLLNALDDAALEQIIFAEKESDYEVYVDHPSNTVSINPIEKGFNTTYSSVPMGSDLPMEDYFGRFRRFSSIGIGFGR
jgi:hypothetical protein